jgi:hypothetical protein
MYESSSYFNKIDYDGHCRDKLTCNRQRYSLQLSEENVDTRPDASISQIHQLKNDASLDHNEVKAVKLTCIEFSVCLDLLV